MSRRMLARPAPKPRGNLPVTHIKTYHIRKRLYTKFGFFTIKHTYTNPFSANDRVCPPATTKWSSTRTSTRPKACLSASVSKRSA